MLRLPRVWSEVFAGIWESTLARGSLADGLATGGFQPDQPAFFLWLGVVPYLTRKAIYSTLRFIGGVPASEIVFDCCEPPETFAPERRALTARVAGAGEPFLSHFDPAELAKELHILALLNCKISASPNCKISASPKWPFASSARQRVA